MKSPLKSLLAAGGLAVAIAPLSAPATTPVQAAEVLPLVDAHLH
jgi:hypothetical protein